MGSAGDSPAPVGDPPTGTAEARLLKRADFVARTVTPVPSGGSQAAQAGRLCSPESNFQKCYNTES